MPLPLIYYVIHKNDYSISIPEEYSHFQREGNVRMKKMVKYFGFDLDLNDDSKVMIELATTYAIVKILMPVRVGLSIFMAPFFAR